MCFDSILFLSSFLIQILLPEKKEFAYLLLSLVFLFCFYYINASYIYVCVCVSVCVEEVLKRSIIKYNGTSMELELKFDDYLVNFLCNLTGPRGTQSSWSNIIPGVSLRPFWIRVVSL